MRCTGAPQTGHGWRKRPCTAMSGRKAVTPSGNAPPASRRSRSIQSTSVARVASNSRASSSSESARVSFTGDVEMGRGAERADTLQFLSGATGWPVETVAAASKGPKMFQLYHFGDRAWVAELLARVEASGYLSVCLTVDTQVYSRRERDVLARWSPREAMKKAPNPRGPAPDYPTRLTWSDVEWLQKTTRLPVGLKGVMTATDAKRAVDMGVRIVWVSNHGGRQLDSTQASIDALPAIADAVGDRADIIIDGGFSRGTAVLKGIAWGARAVAVGRLALWRPAVGGAEGVHNALDILRDELRRDMALCGQTSIKRLTSDCVFRVD